MGETQIIINRLDKLEEQVNDKIDSLENQIKCLDKKLLDPDNGVYARVKENTIFRKNTLKFLAFITLAIMSLVGKLIYDLITGKF